MWFSLGFGYSLGAETWFYGAPRVQAASAAGRDPGTLEIKKNRSTNHMKKINQKIGPRCPQEAPGSSKLGPRAPKIPPKSTPGGIRRGSQRHFGIKTPKCHQTLLLLYFSHIQAPPRIYFFDDFLSKICIKKRSQRKLFKSR